MSEQIEVVVNEGMKVLLTPELMAKAFWKMCSIQQADFFEALAKCIQNEVDPKAITYSLGELQWCYLKDELRQPGRELANQMHMALSAFAFDFWPQKRDGARDGMQQ